MQSAYTIRLNHRHKLSGHVLSGCYKAQLVEGNGKVLIAVTMYFIAAVWTGLGLLVFASVIARLRNS